MFCIVFGVSVAVLIIHCFVCENHRHKWLERKTPNEVCCNNNNFYGYLHGCARSYMMLAFTNLILNAYSAQVYFSMLSACCLLLAACCLLLAVCFPCLVFAACCLLAMLAACCLFPVLGACYLLAMLGARCLVLASRACCLVLDFCLLPVLGA